MSIEVSIIFVRIRHFYFVLSISILLGSGGLAHAIGLGELHIQSGLGQSLQANVILLGTETNEISHTCIRVKVGTTEGVFLAQAAVSIIEIGKNKAIAMSTGLSLNEPAVKITVDVNCEIQLHRDFLVLLDPPEFLPAILSNSPDADIKKAAQIEKAIGISQKSQLSGRPSFSRRDSQKQKSSKRAHPQRVTAKLGEHPIKKIKSIKLEKSTKDVLRLSDDTSFGPEGMKISTTLSPQLEQQISENMEQIRIAQKQMAAILRGEDLNKLAKADLLLDQKKIQTLSAEAALLKNKNKSDSAYFDDIRKNSFSRNWVIGLASLVLASLLIILILFIHVRRMQNSVEASWWEQGREKKEAERRKSIDEDARASYTTDISETYSHVNEGSGYEDPNEASEEPRSDHDTQQFSQGNVSSHVPTLEETNNSVFNFFSSVGSSVKVEEISDITQEAEFWMSVNDPQRAIEILNDQEDVAHPDSPVPWLYLLDLYRLVRNKSKYESLRDRFIVLFNAHIPEFDDELVEIGVLQLEDYPHLIERICRAWNGNAIIPLLEGLLVDDREGKRTGFELPVYRDILLLIAIAHEVEKMRAIEGSKSNSRPEFSEGQTHVETGDLSRNGTNLNMIEFEVIDFPKSTSIKK